MAFKVSNETKVGALAAIAITFLVLGYNFLAGQGSFFSKKYTLNAILPDVTEISKSTPVLFNGYKVGNVTDVELLKPDGKFRVYFVINEDIDIHNDESAMKALEDIAVNMTKWKGSEGAHYADLLEKVIDFLKYGNHRTS